MNAGPRLRSLATACLVLLAAALPALLAGRHLAEPAAPGEYARVLQGLDQGQEDPARSGSAVARLFQGAALPHDAEAAPLDSPAGQDLLGRARLGQMLGVLGLGLLVYLTTMRARGRLFAVATCLVLALLPPIQHDGHVLRPETATAVFGLFGLLVCQGLPDLLRPSRRSRLRRWAVIGLLCACGSVAFGLAVACQPAYGVYLLLPGAALALALGQCSLRLWRTARRRRWPVLPVRAVARRLLPWAMLAAGSIVAAAFLLAEALEVPAASLRPTVTAVELLPASLPLRWLLVLLLVLGVVTLVLQVGLRLGRRGQLDATTLLGLHAAVLLLRHGLGQGGDDALPAAAAAAPLIGQGAAAALLIVFLLRRRRVAR